MNITTKEQLIELIMPYKPCDASLDFINICLDLNEIIRYAPIDYWLFILIRIPELAKYFIRWDEVKSRDLRYLLYRAPKLACYVNFDQLNQFDLTFLKETRPELFEN